MPRPDAVIIPESTKRGDNQVARIASVLKIVEPLLEVARPKEKGHIRRQPDGTLFISRDTKDTLFHPFGTDKEGQPRYEWEATTVPGVDGDVLIGRLIDQPEPAPAAPVQPASTAAPTDQPELKS